MSDDNMSSDAPGKTGDAPEIDDEIDEIGMSQLEADAARRAGADC